MLSSVDRDSYRRSEWSQCCHCQGQERACFLHRLTLKVKRTRYFQTPVTIHQTTWGNTPEDCNLHQYSCKNPKLANPFSFYVLSYQTHCHILSARNTSRNSSATRLTRLSSILPHFLKTTGILIVLLTNVRHFSSID